MFLLADAPSDAAAWIGGIVLLLGGVGSFVITVLKGRSEVKLNEFRELNKHLQEALTKEERKREELETRHDAEMTAMRNDFRSCEQIRVWLEARVESMEFALDRANIPYRKPVPPWQNPTPNPPTKEADGR